MRNGTVTITNASHKDLEPVLRLLESVQLPTAGVADHFSDFFVAKDDGGHLVGTIGLERYNSLGLLRSAAVSPKRQKSGVGSKLTKVLIDFAKAQHLTDLVLFTTGAQAFFARFGFVPADRDEHSALLRNSTQWSCCSSAPFMRLTLQSGDNTCC